MSAKTICHLQVSPAVRLRREAWGGIAFDRAGGDLLDLDAGAFAVLRILKTAQTLPALERRLRQLDQLGRRPDLIALLRYLEQRGFVCRVPEDAQPLPADAWMEEIGGDAGRLRAPLVAHWAVTFRCNLQCPFCYSESGPWRSLGPEGQQLVRRLAEWGVLEVALGGGEPTILPDFPELLATIRAVGMVSNITTNGTIRSAAVVRALADHAGVVHISADRPELLDAARGHGVFARLRATACALRASGVRLGVNLLLTPDNVRDIRSSLQRILDLGAHGVTLLRPKGPWVKARWPGFPRPAELACLADDLKSLLRTRPPFRLYVDTALRDEWARLGLLEDPEPEVLGCGGGQRHVAITPEGEVYPCSHQRRPEYCLGNLLKDDFEQIWSRSSGSGSLDRYLRDCRGVQCPCQTT